MERMALVVSLFSLLAQFSPRIPSTRTVRIFAPPLASAFCVGAAFESRFPIAYAVCVVLWLVSYALEIRYYRTEKSQP